MVVLSVSLCSRSGNPIFSRQSALHLSKSRLESLLSSFPQIIKPGQQHTYVENDSVRFLYHPLDSYYLVLITNKLSNILQDMDTLQMLVKTISEQCDNDFDELTLRNNIFDIIVAFDEIVSLGYRECNNISNLKTYLAMESHEEMVQEIIARNKMQEAREAAKLKMKQIELQKKEAARRSSHSSSAHGYYPGSVTDEPIPSRSIPIESIPISQSHSTPRVGKGMKLGKRLDAKRIVD